MLQQYFFATRSDWDELSSFLINEYHATLEQDHHWIVYNFPDGQIITGSPSVDPETKLILSSQRVFAEASSKKMFAVIKQWILKNGKMTVVGCIALPGAVKWRLGKGRHFFGEKDLSTGLWISETGFPE